MLELALSPTTAVSTSTVPGKSPAVAQEPVGVGVAGDEASRGNIDPVIRNQGVLYVPADAGRNKPMYLQR